MSADRERLKKVAYAIYEAACERIDDPKNVSKGDGWTQMSDEELRELQLREDDEFTYVVTFSPPWRSDNIERAFSEAGDNLVLLSMRMDAWEVNQ